MKACALARFLSHTLAVGFVARLAAAESPYIVALPMKIKGGSGGPLRIVAWVRQ